MRERAYIYDCLLKIQAELSFHLEKPLFQSKLWKEANNIVDYGCGNAWYTKMLADDFPKKSFLGVEIDKSMAEIASQRYHHFDNISIIEGDYNNISSDYKFDFMLLRHVVSYLNDRNDFYLWVQNHANSTGGILVIDADDEYFYISPELPLFLEGIRSFQKKVNEKGQRDVRKDVRDELPKFGFKHINSQRIVVNSELQNLKERIYVYMCLVAELDVGSPLPRDLAEELFSWVLNPESYVQYGFFCSLFARNYDGYAYEKVL